MCEVGVGMKVPPDEGRVTLYVTTVTVVNRVWVRGGERTG